MAFLDEAAEQEILKNKAIRGYIIRALNRNSDGRMYAKQLVNLLASGREFVGPDTAARQLKYLEEGGYIEYVSKTDNAYTVYRRDGVVQLTKKGTDLAEGTIEDGGVEV